MACGRPMRMPMRGLYRVGRLGGLILGGLIAFAPIGCSSNGSATSGSGGTTGAAGMTGALGGKGGASTGGATGSGATGGAGGAPGSGGAGGSPGGPPLGLQYDGTITYLRVRP